MGEWPRCGPGIKPGSCILFEQIWPLKRVPQIRKKQVLTLFLLTNMILVALFAVFAAADQCLDYDDDGCAARILSHGNQGFCSGDWGKLHCCKSCSGFVPSLPTHCKVPRQSCVKWACPSGAFNQAIGTQCTLLSLIHI